MIACLLMLVSLSMPARPVVVRDISGVVRSPLVVPADDRAAVLLFVGSECPISNGYTPLLQKMMREYAGRGVAFYAVYDEASGLVAEHAKAFGLPCPAISDPAGRLAGRVGATVTPEAAVIDRAGRLVYRGRIDDRYLELGRQRYSATTHDLQDALDAVLNGRPVPMPRTNAVGCPL